MFSSLKDKSVIATGGGKGIGKGDARLFADHGAKVLVVDGDRILTESPAALP